MGVGAAAIELPFVGRVDELLLLRRALGDVLARRPRLVLLSGEAGVGKSRLLREVISAAAEDGICVLEGACHEGNAIPYLPVATAFRAIDHESAHRLAPTAEAATAALARGEPVDHRLRLFLDATAALIASATQQPTLLVIEDVHWADDGTADLLRHLVLSSIHEAGVASLPLGVALSVRGAWSTDAPRPLARLVREGSAAEVHLEHLGRAEVHALVRSLVDARPDSEVTGAVLAASSGNPLLVRGVVERNLRAKALIVKDGIVALSSDGELQAPSDLDDEIRRQIGLTDAVTRTLLDLAAVLGDGCLVSTLRAAADAGVDVDGVIRRAVDAGLIAIDGSRICFTHPQIRHVLYKDLDPTIRAKVHLRAAEASETEDAEGGRALAVAHHLLSSGIAQPGERLSRWTLEAGDEAWSTGAYSEALDSYTTALDVGARAVLDAPALTEVLLRAGIAAYNTSHDSCGPLLDEAARLADEQDDLRRRAEARLLRARLALAQGAQSLGTTPPTAPLEELLAQLGDQPALRARTLATLADLHFVGLDHERAAAYAREAEDALAQGVDDLTQAQVHVVLGIQDMGELSLGSAREHFAAAEDTAEEHRRLAAASRRGLCLLAEGDLRRARSVLDAARQGERRVSSPAGQQLPTTGLAALALLDGDVAGAEQLVAEALSLYSILEYAFTPGLAFPIVLAGRLARADDRGAEEAIRAWRDSGGRGTWRYEALARLLRGDDEGLAAELRTRPWPPIESVNLFTLDAPCLHVLVGAALADAGLVRQGLPWLERAHERGVVFTLGWPWCLSRVVADGHLALGEADAAERWYQRAETETGDGAASLERALVRLGRARVALARGRPDRAHDLAAESAGALDSMGLLRLAGHAQQLLERTTGPAAPTPRDRYILFTDIVGSTELNVRSGDEGYVRLIEEHDRIMRARFRHHDGVEHAHTGDGMSAWFATAEVALACAFGILADLERASLDHPALPVRVRIGIAAGRPVHSGDKLFGLAVVTASRVCAKAGPDEVLVSDAVRAAAPLACTYRAHSEGELKGLPGTHRLFTALGPVRE